MAVADPIGAKVYIGPVTAAVTASAYAALSYTEIKDVDTLPEFGNASNIVKYTPLATGIVQKKKGSRDNGDPDLVCFLNNTDPGQIAAKAAAGSKFAYAFKVVIPDADDASAADSVYYFHAIVSKATSEAGGADNIPRRRFGLGVTTDVIEVPTT